MHAAADRPEFAPPPQPGMLRGFALAVLAHLLLVAGLMHGLQWQREAQNAAVEAELWSALPQEAAPREVAPPPPIPVPPPPPPQPVVKAPPQPEPPVRRDADIALEREKHKRELQQQKLAEEREREREQRRKDLALKKKEEELARKKELQKQQLAEAKRKEEDSKRKQQELEAREARDAKKLAQLREENMKRMQGMAGTGAPSSAGTAARSSGPSESWQGRVIARVRPNIVFTDEISGNPRAEVEVRTSPDGTIVGKRLVRSSGVKAWDDAVLRALDKTEVLPRDIDGRVPSPVVIGFRPRS
jgi:colicin import membrane protein